MEINEKINKKQLAVRLSRLKALKEFSEEKAKILLEQYQIDSESAAEVLWWAYMNGDVAERIVADFGCGNGVLGIGALLLGAKKAYFVDIDASAMKVVRHNLELFECGKNGGCINLDISNFNKLVDTAIQNPPFGTKKKHTDKIFLEKAMQSAKVVYSIHKITSKGFIRKLAEEKGFYISDVLEFELPLRKTLWFHKKKIYKVKVGCWRLMRVDS